MMCELPAVQECDATLAEPQVQKKQQTTAEIAAGLGVTENKYLAMLDYAKQLKRTNPKMKVASIRSKVAAKYKIKLL